MTVNRLPIKGRPARFLPGVLAALLLASLCSCVGANADISLRADGSGKLVLEYRVSQMAEALGKLDGNERWQIVPVGRADFERSVARLPGLRLASFSSTNDERTIVNRAELEFKDIQDIVAFLDPRGTGKRASLARENGKNRLSLVLSEGLPEIDPDLLSLIRETSAGYGLNFSLSVPGTATLTLTDGAGGKINTPPENAVVVSPGKKVSLSISTGELLSLPGGLGMEFGW